MKAMLSSSPSVGDEAVVLAARRPVARPTFAGRVLAAVPAGLDAPALHRAREEGAAGGHPALAFASGAAACARGVVVRAQPARQPADGHLRVADPQQAGHELKRRRHLIAVPVAELRAGVPVPHDQILQIGIDLHADASAPTTAEREHGVDIRGLRGPAQEDRLCLEPGESLTNRRQEPAAESGGPGNSVVAGLDSPRAGSPPGAWIELTPRRSASACCAQRNVRVSI